MIKKQIYPKTKRITNNSLVVTEKIDGSNLVFYKLNDYLFVAQRNNIFNLNELEEVKDKLYKGLYDWLKKHGKDLRDNLNENSAICGEWLGMGRIKYNDIFEVKFLMFAKANVEDSESILSNLIYSHDLFIYPFVNQEIPSYIGKVPIVAESESLNIEKLDNLYEEYTEQQGRIIEGFVVNNDNIIRKYVRHKNGKLTPHEF